MVFGGDQNEETHWAAHGVCHSQQNYRGTIWQDT